MRVLFLTHYWSPERGAPQTRLREMSVGLQRLGHEVRVVTGPPHYPTGHVLPGYSARTVSRASIDGVEVLRLPMIPRPNGGFVDRVIDQASFAAAAAAAVPAFRWADAVFVESPPLFLGLTAAFHGIVSRAPYLFHVADPWPDFPIAMGALDNPVARSVAFSLERLAYRRAGIVTTVSPGLVKRLDRKPAAHGKVRLLPNGVDLARFDPEGSALVARRRLGWPETPLTIAYVGSVGLAQGVGTLIDAAAPLAAEGVTVRIVGEGFEWQQLSESVRGRGLQHIHFDPAVAASEVPTVLAAADALVVMLKRGPLYEESLPTKLVEGLAAGRPLIVSAAGEPARLVEDASAGYVAPPEDVAGLRAAIRSFVADPDRASRGRRGRILAAERFDRQAIVAQLAGYLEEVAGSGSRPPDR